MMFAIFYGEHGNFIAIYQKSSFINTQNRQKWLASGRA